MYTIKFSPKSQPKLYKVLTYLQERLAKEGVFRAGLRVSGDSILVKPVRLVKAKPYCGNHPGECQVPLFGGPHKNPRATYLEWDDWVRFHGVVNRVLNRFRIEADVWSTPHDVKGKMWIRKGLKARKRYEWEETVDRYSRTVRIWNQGTEDQF